MWLVTCSILLFMHLLFFGMGGYILALRSALDEPVGRNETFLQNDTQNKINEVSNEKDPQRQIFTERSINKTKVRRSVSRSLGLSNPMLERKSRVNNVINNRPGRPRFPNTHTPVLEFDSDKYVCNDTQSSRCIVLTNLYHTMVQKEFCRIMMSEGNVLVSGLASQNMYNVQYGGEMGKTQTQEEIICKLRGVQVATVSAQDMETPRVEPLRNRQRYSTCAVVSSSGAMLGSRLGAFIDSHDMVLRFNNAPTRGYEGDVGSKTTFRVVNSQVATKPEFNFLQHPMYANVSIIVWDPANYTSTVEEWFQRPNFPLFDVYKNFLELRPGADIHLLNPRVLWSLWDILQQSSEYRMRKHPPSSGFIGMWYAMTRCHHVRAFQFMPSARATERCHYYETRRDRACTIGSWHPLAQEKTLANQLRSNSNFEVYQRGFIQISNNFTCPE